MGGKMDWRLFTAGLLLGLAAPFGAQAAGFLSGSFSLVGGFDCGACYGPGDDHVVSHLMLLEAASPAKASEGFGSFAAIHDVDALPVQAIDLAEPPAVYGQFDLAGFSLVILGVRDVVRSGLACVSGACQDSLRFRFWGEVSGHGYLPTHVAGVWTGQGSCVGRSGVCRSQPSASWSASISAVRLPEPASLALMGLGLLVVGAATWRRRHSQRSRATRAVSD